MWHKQSFTQFWSQSDAYSRRSSLKLTYIHHPLVVCTHQICCAVAVPIALSQDRLLHGHNRLVNWTPCSRMRESKLKIYLKMLSAKYCLSYLDCNMLNLSVPEYSQQVYSCWYSSSLCHQVNSNYDTDHTKWQLQVQPVMKISSKWQYFNFSASVSKCGTSLQVPCMWRSCWSSIPDPIVLSHAIS